MGRYIGPKDRLSRREGFDLYNSGAKIKKANVHPGQHGIKNSGKVSQYGLQLRAKQRAKRFYGIYERQFRNYVKKASNSKTKTGDVLVSLLERRLDNIIFRLGLAKTRPAARQFVTHGHVNVDGKKMNVPSYEVKLNETISLTPKILESANLKEFIDDNKPSVPDWLLKNKNGGKVLREPNIGDLPEPISITDIIEFYSR